MNFGYNDLTMARAARQASAAKAPDKVISAPLVRVTEAGGALRYSHWKQGPRLPL